MTDSALALGVAGRTVLIAGATSASGHACAAALSAAGARVIAVGSNAERLAELAQAVPGVITRVCDLGDFAAVSALAEEIRVTAAKHGHAGIDGLIHLVGGWRGGGGLAGQSDSDYRFLERSLTALRHVSRAFDADLRESSAGRLAIVSSTAVARPLAGGANYAAIKAASEAWTRAVGQGFAKGARDGSRELNAAAVIFRTKSLEGLEGALADAFIALWSDDAEDWNDVIVELGDGG